MPGQRIYEAENEKALLFRVAEGDEKAFSLLMRQYSATVYSHCLAYLKSVDQAEEITQDIFLQIWHIRGKLREIERFEDYLFILSRNLIYRSFRKIIKEMATLSDQHNMEPAQQPDLQTEYRDSYQLLLKGIELLPEKRKQAFKLSRLEGKKHDEIAAIMGINKVTVAQYIMLAIDFLKSYLKQHSGDAILVTIILLVREVKKILFFF